ncbi:MAG: response regulator [Planctomycetes bacterium]|nr:response regulator [Planctomycetota bacterium]
MKPHVLMVDDNPGDLQMIEEAFKDSRIDVSFHSARHAAEALEHLTRHEVCGTPLPDVVILDLNMPGLGGRDIISIMRGDRAWKHIPIVVFSGDASIDAQRTCQELGAHEVVVKPGTYSKYLSLVQRLPRFWRAPAQRPARAS